MSEEEDDKQQTVRKENVTKKLRKTKPSFLTSRGIVSATRFLNYHFLNLHSAGEFAKDNCLLACLWSFLSVSLSHTLVVNGSSVKARLNLVVSRFGKPTWVDVDQLAKFTGNLPEMLSVT